MLRPVMGQQGRENPFQLRRIKRLHQCEKIVRPDPGNTIPSCFLCAEPFKNALYGGSDGKIVQPDRFPHPVQPIQPHVKGCIQEK